MLRPYTRRNKVAIVRLRTIHQGRPYFLMI
jgi:hypothetical protein